MNQQQRPSYLGAPRSVSISSPEGIPKTGRRVTLTGISNKFPYLSQTSYSNSASVTSESRPSQWESLMRNFSQDHKKTLINCKKDVSDVMRCEVKEKKNFATGSSYEGTWNGFGFCGFGEYTFPNGVVYEGEFEDSVFHGEGELRYPDGIILKGRWEYGENVERNIIFADGMRYKEEDWKYCTSADRRYTREYKGLVGAGKPNLTNELPPREIPEGTYDTGDGVFDPKMNKIHHYDDPDNVLRVPDAAKVKWLKANCRSNPDKPVGACPELYKDWLEPVQELDDLKDPSLFSYGGDDGLSRMTSTFYNEMWDTVSTSKFGKKACRSASGDDTYFAARGGIHKDSISAASKEQETAAYGHGASASRAAKIPASVTRAQNSISKT